MSVRKRTWNNTKGERQEAWIVDYVDQKGKRPIRSASYPRSIQRGTIAFNTLVSKK